MVAMSYTSKCPKCGSYNSGIQIDLIDHDDKASMPASGTQPITSRTRMFHCKTCGFIWAETTLAPYEPSAN